MKVSFIILLLYSSFSYSQNTLEIPFTYENNLINIDVDVNGIKEKFIFDTGAFNILTKKFADKQKLNLKKGRKVGGYVAKTQSYITSVKTLKIHNKIISSTSFTVLDWKFINDLNIAGIFSISNFTAMGYQTFMIDYKNQKIILGAIQPITFDYKFKMVKKGYPRIVSGKNKFLIDTGNPLFGESNKNIFQNIKTCEKYSSYALSFANKNIDLCKNDLPDENGRQFEFKYFSFEGQKNVIGNLNLQNFNVFINLKNKELFLTKNLISPTLSDIYFFNNENGFYVGLINESSELFNFGIRTGYRLSEINNLKTIAS